MPCPGGRELGPPRRVPERRDRAMGIPSRPFSQDSCIQPPSPHGAPAHIPTSCTWKPVRTRAVSINIAGGRDPPRPTSSSGRSPSSSFRCRLAETMHLCVHQGPICTSAEARARRLVASCSIVASIDAQGAPDSGAAGRRRSGSLKLSSRQHSLHEPTVKVNKNDVGSSVAARGGLAHRLGRALVQRARRDGPVPPRATRP